MQTMYIIKYTCCIQIIVYNFRHFSIFNLLNNGSVCALYFVKQIVLSISFVCLYACMCVYMYVGYACMQVDLCLYTIAGLFHTKFQCIYDINIF
jgi:hypothetical protein